MTIIKLKKDFSLLAAYLIRVELTIFVILFMFALYFILLKKLFKIVTPTN